MSVHTELVFSSLPTYRTLNLNFKHVMYDKHYFEFKKENNN